MADEEVSESSAERTHATPTTRRFPRVLEPDRHTDKQAGRYYTILTIDFIIDFSSAPDSPPLIFTTRTSITVTACKKIYNNGIHPTRSLDVKYHLGRR